MFGALGAYGGLGLFMFRVLENLGLAKKMITTSYAPWASARSYFSFCTQKTSVVAKKLMSASKVTCVYNYVTFVAAESSLVH